MSAARDVPGTAKTVSLRGDSAERRGFSLWRRRNEDVPDTPADALPRFAVSATEDLGDVAEALGDDFSVSRARLALAKVLSASLPVIHREGFAGRADTMAALIAAIEQQRSHVVLYGERGIGKTSLIHVFAETAREARYLVLYGSCGVEARFDTMFRAFAEQIPLLYHASISPTADESEHQRTFADLLDEQPVDPRQLAELFGEIVGTRVLLILDEYDRVADPAFRRDVAELIKNLSDRAARMQLILTGVASNLEELIGFTPSIRRNIVGLPIGPMPESEMLEILGRAEEASGMRFAPEARTLIIQMAGGSPYLTRLLANRAAARALDEKRSTVSEQDVNIGTENILAEWNTALPRRVQAQLQLPKVREAWPSLIAAARASGTPDGWFVADDVVAELPGIDRTQAVALLDQFATEVEILDRRAAGSGTDARYRFHTQGVPQLLQLSAALARAGR